MAESVLRFQKKLIQAGADILVAGSAVFNSEDPIQTIKQMKQG